MRCRTSPQLAIIGLLVLLTLLALVAANLGALTLSFRTLWREPFSDAAWHIWLNIRLPRVLLAVVIGCALAVSGAVMQGLFRNPLADPSLLGISSGGALFVALFIVMPLALPVTIALYGHMLAAFLGSLLVSLLIYGISRSGHGNLSRLLLAGIAINALCMAAIGVLSYVSSDQQLRQFSLWMMGSLSQSQWPTLAVSASLILPTALLTLLQARRLNLLQLGDEEAHYLGVNVQRAKLQLLLLSALLIGAAVAMSGVIGFVGLVVPHLVRMRLGGDHRWLLPCSALGGACLLLVSDTLARTLVAPAEMPVGLMTSLIGGPYFLWLVMRQRSEPVDNAACLTARELRYSLGARRLINDVSLSLVGGEMVAIIGPNGAGKSTLLRLLTGYLTPDCGECRLLDRPLEQWAPQQLAKVRAVMRQYSDLAFPFSVEEVVSMGRAPHGKRDEHQAIQQVMAQTDCLALAQRDYRQLSGGEQQRVQLARVLAQLWQPQPSPAWLFLDEPTSALDLYHQQHTLRLLRSLTRQQPLGVCCVLHDLNLAALYADRILLLHQGRLVASGTPQEVLQTEILTRWYQADLGVVHHPEVSLPQVYLRQ